MTTAIRDKAAPTARRRGALPPGVSAKGKGFRSCVWVGSHRRWTTTLPTPGEAALAGAELRAALEEGRPVPRAVPKPRTVPPCADPDCLDPAGGEPSPGCSVPARISLARFGKPGRGCFACYWRHCNDWTRARRLADRLAGGPDPDPPAPPVIAERKAAIRATWHATEGYRHDAGPEGEPWADLTPSEACRRLIEHFRGGVAWDVFGALAKRGAVTAGGDGEGDGD